jgi:ATP-binding protein involved in chromosome partitioning
VLSGKGGVGKSTVAVNLAAELARGGKQVGLLDVDIHGPSIPGMFGLENSKIFSNGSAIIPMEFTANLTIMSIGFLLQDRGDAVIWRGPMKYHAIRQFISDVEWGELDYLVVDSPPGTGDEPLSVVQLMGEKARSVVVTTPQRVSIDDVRKCIQFCEKLNTEILGVIENMSGFACPHCGKTVNIFDSGGGALLAKEKNVRFLGRIPIEQAIVHSCDEGKPYILTDSDSATAKAFSEVVKKIRAIYADE